MVLGRSRECQIMDEPAAWCAGRPASARPPSWTIRRVERAHVCGGYGRVPGLPGGRRPVGAYSVYAEWPQRENRRGDARERLRLAHGMFSRSGEGADAGRAALELWATGEAVARRGTALRRP